MPAHQPWGCELGTQAHLVRQHISLEGGIRVASFACLLHLVQQSQVGGVLHASKCLAGYLKLQGLQGCMAQHGPLAVWDSQAGRLSTTRAVQEIAPKPVVVGRLWFTTTYVGLVLEGTSQSLAPND